MYIAELRGKFSKKTEGMEDILTSNVFSFFKYANRTIFLKSFLHLFDIQVSDSDVENAEFHFWPRYVDNTEPDLVLIVGKYYLLIEAKYYSSFDWTGEKDFSQLLREIRGGLAEARNLDKVLYLITVTADYLYKPEDFFQVGELLPLPRFKWINWQQICNLLLNILDNENLTLETRLFCQDLCSLLDKKNLRSFRNIKEAFTGEVLVEPVSRIFLASETTTLRGDFIGFESTLSALAQLNELPKSIFLRNRPFFVNTRDSAEIKWFAEKIFFNKEI